MTCHECIDFLLSQDLSEIGDHPAGAHCRSCASCANVLETLVAGERTLAFSLASARPSLHPVVLADRALMGTRLRTVERTLFAVFLVACSLILWLGLRGLPPSTVNLLTGRRPMPTFPMETIGLRCLSPQQAHDLVEPYFRSPGSGVIVNAGSIPAVSLTGTQSQRDAARKVIAQFEGDRDAPCRR